VPQPKGLIPPIYFLITVLLEIGIGVLPAARFIPESWRPVGIALILAGLAFAIWGNRQFSRAGTTVHPFEEASQLVTTGAFRFSRNPMYLGMVLVLIGTAVILGKLIPLLFPFVFGKLISILFIRHEEIRLQTQFGAPYVDYMRRVRRWI